MWVFVQGGGKGIHDHVLRQSCIRRTKIFVLGQKSMFFVLKLEIYTTNCYLISTKEHAKDAD